MLKLISDFHAWGEEGQPREFSRDKSVRIGKNGKAFWRLQRWRPPSSSLSALLRRRVRKGREPVKRSFPAVIG
jgi:hypothetical protein